MSRPTSKDWFESVDDAFWLMTDEDPRRAAAFVRRALRLRCGQRVLDVPCGAGRIAIELARAGCCVTGVDRRETFIRRCRAAFSRARLEGVFRVGDMRNIDEEGEFDAVLNWFGSFGYFDDAENARLVGRFSRALRDGGRLLIDQVNRRAILRGFEQTVWRGDVSIEHAWDRESERVVTRWATIRAPRRTSTSSIRVYTPAQTRAMIDRAGLVVEATFGDADGRPYSRSSDRYVVVARKP